MASFLGRSHCCSEKQQDLTKDMWSEWKMQKTDLDQIIPKSELLPICTLSIQWSGYSGLWGSILYCRYGESLPTMSIGHMLRLFPRQSSLFHGSISPRPAPHSGNKASFKISLNHPGQCNRLLPVQLRNFHRQFIHPEILECGFSLPSFHV